MKHINQFTILWAKTKLCINNVPVRFRKCISYVYTSVATESVLD